MVKGDIYSVAIPKSVEIRECPCQWYQSNMTQPDRSQPWYHVLWTRPIRLPTRRKRISKPIPANSGSGIHGSIASSANSLTATISATMSPGQADVARRSAASCPAWSPWIRYSVKTMCSLFVLSCFNVMSPVAVGLTYAAMQVAHDRTSTAFFV